MTMEWLATIKHEHDWVTYASNLLLFIDIISFFCPPFFQKICKNVRYKDGKNSLINITISVFSFLSSIGSVAFSSLVAAAALPIDR